MICHRTRNTKRQGILWELSYLLNLEESKPSIRGANGTIPFTVLRKRLHPSFLYFLVSRATYFHFSFSTLEALFRARREATTTLTQGAFSTPSATSMGTNLAPCSISDPWPWSGTFTHTQRGVAMKGFVRHLLKSSMDSNIIPIGSRTCWSPPLHGAGEPDHKIR
jgi:hypothetical protein